MTDDAARLARWQEAVDRYFAPAGMALADEEIAAALAAAVVSSSPATPEGGRQAQQRIDAALALCHRADYGGDDWPYPDHYVPASRIRDALTDIDPTPSPASPAEEREMQRELLRGSRREYARPDKPASPAPPAERPESWTGEPHGVLYPEHCGQCWDRTIGGQRTKDARWAGQ